MQVSRLVAKGGGDIPEDVLPALDAAAKLSWAARARFALLITDAPCHGRDCNDCPDDKYPSVSFLKL
jgi:myosin protein heavy chain